MTKLDKINLGAKRIEFELFCKVRNWQIEDFCEDRKNRGICYGYCMDNYGTRRVYQVDREGKYFLLLGNKMKRPISYVLENQKEGDAV